eukprot:366520-Chlamydomonas_euryale.AAC.2
MVVAPNAALCPQRARSQCNCWVPATEMTQAEMGSRAASMCACSSAVHDCGLRPVASVAHDCGMTAVCDHSSPAREGSLTAGKRTTVTPAPDSQTCSHPFKHASMFLQCHEPRCEAFAHAFAQA